MGHDTTPADSALSSLRRGSDVDRTIFFSDAVFAIAMTLLVLELRVPEMPEDTTTAEFTRAVAEQIPHFIGFILSFVLIGQVWIIHHRRFSVVREYTGRLQALNLATLFFVAFMPVPTGMLFQNSGDSPIPTIIYALTIALLYLSLDLVWWYAHREGLLDESVTEPLYRLVLHATISVPIVFLASIPLSFINPNVALFSWVLNAPAARIVGVISRRRYNRDVAAANAG